MMIIYIKNLTEGECWAQFFSREKNWHHIVQWLRKKHSIGQEGIVCYTDNSLNLIYGYNICVVEDL